MHTEIKAIGVTLFQLRMSQLVEWCNLKKHQVGPRAGRLGPPHGNQYVVP